jgi:hypothetical protein
MIQVRPQDEETIRTAKIVYDVYVITWDVLLMVKWEEYWAEDIMILMG